MKKNLSIVESLTRQALLFVLSISKSTGLTVIGSIGYEFIRHRSLASERAPSEAMHRHDQRVGLKQTWLRVVKGFKISNI